MDAGEDVFIRGREEIGFLLILGECVAVGGFLLEFTSVLLRIFLAFLQNKYKKY